MQTAKQPRSSRARYRAFLEEPPPREHGGATKHADRPAATTPARGYFREYLTWLWPFRLTIITAFALGLTSALLSLALPQATMYIIDSVLPSRDLNMLHTLGWLMLGVILFQQGIDLTRNWTTVRLNARVIWRLRGKLYQHLLGLPLHQLADMKTGGIVSRLSGDIDSVTGLMQSAILTPAIAVVKVIVTLVLLMGISWKLSLTAILFLPILVVLNLASMRKIRPIYRSTRQDRAAIDARVVETFAGIRVVRAFSRERTERHRYALQHHTIIRKNLRAQMLEYAVWAGWGFLIPLAALLIIWFGGTLVLSGQATIGGIVAFQMYLMMLLVPVSTIVRSYGEMQQALAAMERVFDLLAAPMDKPDRTNARIAPQRVESIEFDGVSFAYRADHPVLREFSLRAAGGATVALVGPSGSGKTTVTNLVARFYDPDAGAVRLNGVDLRDFTLRSYRRLLGLVQQDVFLFDGTIAENIAYARPGASSAQIEDAARRANAHQFITGFPEGYATIVGERGVRLSGGQAQRVSIARAILADPAILILDEATSNLDSESEHLIQESLRTLLAHRTTFVIAHRLSTIANADMIVVLDGGRIVAVGTHADLLVSSEMYRAMVERQQRAMDDALSAGEPAPVS